MEIDVEGFKQGQRAMWAMGDYPGLARQMEPMAEALVQRAGIAAGERVLDVATGSGNVAIAAARAGARVTGLDLTPELLVAARERAEGEGLEVEWLEGDAEQLPFADGTFERTTSAFGVMFAPRHDLAARELVRVTSPGGTIAVTAWTPEGVNGRLFGVIGAYMPAPPPEMQTPLMWGREDHVRELFAHSGGEIECERAFATFRHDSPESWVSYNERVLGPAMIAHGMLEAQGRAHELHEDMVRLYTEVNEAGEDGLRFEAEYLLTRVRLPEAG